MTPPPAKQAFSLVELSIVLVILGLLVGGVLTGQSLIRAAELRSVTTEYQKYAAAVHTFRDKYFALPGDMTNATSFWGSISVTQATCISTASSDNKATCNGDGDGYVNKTTYYASGGYERYHFWLHLAAAGLIEGSYNGLTSTPGNFGYTPGVNVPKAKIGGNMGWTASGLVGDFTSDTDPNRFPRVFDSSVVLGVSGSSWFLKPEELWNIDTKIDDGKPALGNVWTYKTSGTWATGCATGDTLAAEYNLTNTNRACGFAAEI